MTARLPEEPHYFHNTHQGRRVLTCGPNLYVMESWAFRGVGHLIGRDPTEDECLQFLLMYREYRLGMEGSSLNAGPSRTTWTRSHTFNPSEFQTLCAKVLEGVG